MVKQADVLMLHHLVPDEVEPDSLVPNLRLLRAPDSPRQLALAGDPCGSACPGRPRRRSRC